MATIPTREAIDTLLPVSSPRNVKQIRAFEWGG